MLANNNGKLLVCASSFASREKRLKSVNSAAEKMAKLLNADVEFVAHKKKFKPIYVYYKSGDEEPIPIYCNKGEKSEMQDVYATLSRMMFVLSFHPKHSALKFFRKEMAQLPS